MTHKYETSKGLKSDAFSERLKELEKRMNNKLKTLITSKEKWDAFGDCLDNVYSKKMRDKKNEN